VTPAADTPVSRQLHRLALRLAVPLRLRLWNGAQFDLGRDPKATLVLTQPRLLRALLSGNVDRLCDAYVRGELRIEGPLEDVLKTGIELVERIGRRRWLTAVARVLPRRRHDAGSDARWVQFHYDVSNDFYRLWLDRRMVYSCAYFETGTEEIDQAQEQKLDHLCRKLRLAPGERLLDVGCGWGGLLCFAAERYGIHGVGITLSRQQYEYAARAVEERGLAGRLEIRLQDYRELGGEVFDKIVSVGMYEHVGHANLPLYFAKLAALAKPGGLVLNHGITTTDPSGASKAPQAGSFIERYVFPGGELPHLSRVIREMAAQDLDVLDVESLRPHYAATLLHWVRRLEARKAEAIALAGEERHRIWRMYMAGCALAFERNWLSIYQVLAGKCEPGGALKRPWTRRHQYVADDPLAMPGPLDWRRL
jgi:cyclopropane-fatty-acyl-phospholipid synthase